jgi:signal transduction histidine kinase
MSDALRSSEAFQGDVVPDGGAIGARVLSLDWSATPLGAVDRWPRSLQSVVRMMLASHHPMWMVWGPDKTFLCNDAFAPHLGPRPSWALGQPAERVWGESWAEIGPRVDQVLRTGQTTYSQGMRLFLDRVSFPEEGDQTLSYSPLFDDHGAIAGVFAALAIDNARLFQAAQREIEQRRATEAALQRLNAELEQRVAAEVAERMKIEEALRQAQKMEAVGQLTGGVAHDFNNLLTVIMGGLETVRRHAPTENKRLNRAIDLATQGADRAAILTSRLLAFSRRQPLDPRPLDLNLVVRQYTELLHRTLGETIALEGVLSPGLWPVELDQNQLETAILNLAVNARDAMAGGGDLTIETANTLLDESRVAADAAAAPGQYAMLSISDTGTGMSRYVLERAFEPFYTTKEVGKGTGLGLSMVYGFVKQSGGHVTIYSEPGAGTAVKLFFPRYCGAPDSRVASPRARSPKGAAGETVLLVEDNDDVRAYSASVLTELGYGVVEAADAEAGLAVLRQRDQIDLLFTDVVLPGRSGRELVEEARGFRPDLKVLYTTGYSRDAIVHQGRLEPGVNLLAKPFTFDQLAQRLRDVLDG